MTEPTLCRTNDTRPTTSWVARSGALALLVVACGTVMLALPAEALAQSAERLRPPAPQQPADPPVVRNLMVAALVVASIVAASLIPAKRGHQD